MRCRIRPIFRRAAGSTRAAVSQSSAAAACRRCPWFASRKEWWSVIWREVCFNIGLGTGTREGGMGVQLKFGAAIFAAALLGAGASPAPAQKSADTLRISMRDALPNIDPYYNN